MNDKLREALEDAKQLRWFASSLTYNDTTAEGEAKHRLHEIAMRIESGYYQREALAASKQEPSIVLTNAYRADIDRAKRDALEASKAIFSKQEPQSTMVDKQSTKHEPQAEPFPESNSDCKNRHKCWEPCGELGKSKAHVKVHVPQAQAGEPIRIKMLLKQIEILDSVIAKKDAAMDACVEALQESKQNILASAQGFYEEYGTTKQTLDEFLDKQLIAEIDAAITQSEEARK